MDIWAMLRNSSNIANIKPVRRAVRKGNFPLPCAKQESQREEGSDKANEHEQPLGDRHTLHKHFKIRNGPSDGHKGLFLKEMDIL